MYKNIILLFTEIITFEVFKLFKYFDTYTNNN